MTGRPEDGRLLAVAIHGIEPATFERCALIRDWLADHGVQRVTLLVIPARDLHPVGGRSPEMVEWLAAQRARGDAIAQHGFRHVCGRRTGAARALRSLARGSRAGEFTALDEPETRRAVESGWRILKLAGIEPDGFVAPAYAYTPALRRTLTRRFRWWASLLRVHGTAEAAPVPALAPAFSLATGGAVARALSPSLVRCGSLLPARTLRVDVHPAHLQHPRHMLALQGVLERSGGRTPVTYEDLAGRPAELPGATPPRGPAEQAAGAERARMLPS